VSKETRIASVTDPVPARMVPGTVLAARYRLEEIVGTGGMAIVWRARDERLERPVAVKMMSDALSANPAYVARFAQEARIAAQISHPNLVEIFDYDATAAQPYLVMQFVDGGTLEGWLARTTLDTPVIEDLARDLLAALSAVHLHGVLHRDVKPANVLIGSDGRARLTDFGVARLEDSTHLTQAGHLVGTLRFLAPELAGGAEPSAQSDLYSLGMLLRDAAGDRATGRLARLIDRLTAAAPDERPASAKEALAQLRKPAHERSPSATPSAAPSAAHPVDRSEPTRVMRTPATVTRHRPSRAPVAISAALLIGVVIAVVAIVGFGVGGGSTQGNHATRTTFSLPRSATLQQRLSALQREVRSAPGG
jgi:eukaryotic-like serine/threonine-protein kinase